MYIEHKVFGTKKNVNYMDREGVYLVPAKDGKVGVVKTSKGYFLLGGGLDSGESHEECIKRECLEESLRVLKKVGLLITAEIQI